MCLIDYSLLSAHHSFMRQMCMKHPLCTRNGVPSYPPYIPGTGPCLSLLPPFRSQPPATPLCRPGPEDRGENSSQDCCEMQTGNLHERTFIAVVQSLSCVQLFATPWTNPPGFPVLHHLPEFAQIHVHRIGDAIQPFQPLRKKKAVSALVVKLSLPSLFSPRDKMPAQLRRPQSPMQLSTPRGSPPSQQPLAPVTPPSRSGLWGVGRGPTETKN